MSTPGILAARAVHQYRRRDILTYVGLRQHLRNRSAQRDVWGNDIATALVMERSAGCYHPISTFKEIGADGELTFRELLLPPPHETLAEAALLAACAAAGGPFGPHPSVFSYELSSGNEVNGIFRPYFRGFIDRHKAIAAACRGNPTAVVIHTDVRRFYPSITGEVARAAWLTACEAANLGTTYRTLGSKILADYERAKTDGAVLTGPMFSHMLGNLVFRAIDNEMSTRAPGCYFRYVDDVAIVAPSQMAIALEHHLERLLEVRGLTLNSKKRLEVPAAEWVKSEADFDDVAGPSWKSFVGQMKQMLMLYPDVREYLRAQFQEHGIRIRPLDYSEVEQERSYLTRTATLLKRRWFRRKTRSLAMLPVVAECLALRKQYFSDAQNLLSRFNQLDGFERKRSLYRLRFLTSRLVYIAHPDDLKFMEDALAGVPEFAMVSTVFRCLHDGDVTPLLRFGPAAAQAAAQPLKALSRPLRCRPREWSDVSVQAYAILRLNGITFSEGPSNTPDDPLIRFCEWDDRARSLWDSRNAYFRELACVHGMTKTDLNSWAIETAFDRDDDLVFDMQELMQGSS
ncbi:MAG TPA: RNA-directed DNA polymerase [Opitutaceae bacterium]|nr:RNA-directed DNA polymerase [Opitutaceae bacterium]